MSEVDVMEELRLWLPAVLFVSQIFVYWLLWSLRSAFVSKGHCEKCRNDIDNEADALERRIIRNEEQLANQPTNREVTQLNLTLQELAGDVNVLAERIEGVKDSQTSIKELVIRVDTFLREQR
ncbi:DUF2730 family protein [Maridesulfovibrio sp.]|uniref:DUF2730 family protein n=1 Tax=Maridesulfovibrio sp. TaxID=2795000 RepID=UPI0029C9EF94|nr:DUF2730 family protein [Maridesulfovibrio sp.]